MKSDTESREVVTAMAALVDTGWTYRVVVGHDEDGPEVHQLTQTTRRGGRFTATVTAVALDSDRWRFRYRVINPEGFAVPDDFNCHVFGAASVYDAARMAWDRAREAETAAELELLRHGYTGGPFGVHRYYWLTVRHPYLSTVNAVTVAFGVQLCRYQQGAMSVADFRAVTGDTTAEWSPRHIRTGLRAARAYLSTVLGVEFSA
ncbi:hypothetical protein [Nocardia sp. NPDC051750]|uniref:hypothetical protein n=1 Tax=Nocardia sp. NPDC051750 TaxID=3364325 RepID=UPI00379AF1C0